MELEVFLEIGVAEVTLGLLVVGLMGWRLRDWEWGSDEGGLLLGHQRQLQHRSRSGRTFWGNE